MWYLSDLGRLNRERSAVEALEAANDWLDGVHWQLDGGAMVIHADIVLSGEQRHAVCLRFPEHYPSVPPSVRPRDPERWSSHQYGDTGDLCLELGPDNWHPDTHDASHMLTSTHRLLMLEADHAGDRAVEIPSRHRLTDGQKFRAEVFRWVLTPAAREALDNLPDESAVLAEFYVKYHEHAMIALVRRIDRPGTESWVDPDLPADLKRVGYPAKALIITGQYGALALTTMSDSATLTKVVEDHLPRAADSDKSSRDQKDIDFVAVQSAGSDWQAWMRWQGGDRISACSTIDVDVVPPGTRLGYETEKLDGVTVAVVGLGSAGSKIATSLARSGVGRFILLDDDLLHPCNLVRHDGDWFGVGQHKVDAVADRLTFINPAVDIICRKHRLGGQESTTSAASALTALGKADLIIDATASPSVFNLCAHVARQSKTSLIWLEIYAGGIGGLVARARHAKDPEPFTLRNAINEAAGQIAREKDAVSPDSLGDYAAAHEDAIIIASDADVTTIAGVATQMVIDALLGREPSHYPYPAYLIGLTRGWVFDQPLQTMPIECSAPVDWSTVVHTDKGTCEEAAVFLVQLLEAQSPDADVASSE